MNGLSGVVEENVPVTGVTPWNNRTSPNGVPLKKNHTPGSPSGMISVLYVDDELNLLDVTKTYLEKTKEFTVTTAPSASVALELLKSNGIQVIVSDYQMPEMDGIEFLKTVRATDKRIPFIIFTGKGREEIAIEAFENGADFYLQKGGEPKSQFADLSHRIKKAVDHRRADIQVTALNRLYTVLSATNKAIVRIHDKTELLNEICRVVVDIGGFAMAWAGFANPEKHLIEPVAMAGHVEGYLDTNAVSTDDIPRGRGPTGTAFRTRTFNVSNDIARDPTMEPWREEALERGYRSLAAFPFALDTNNPGIITVYASEPGFFTDQIIRLLDEQSSDLSFAFITLDHEEQRIAAENDLKKSELQYRRLFETAQDAILILDGDTGKIIDANRFILDMLGYSLEYFVGKHLWELGFIKDKTLAQRAFTELQTNSYIRYEDLPLETKDGRSIDVEFVSNAYLVGDKKIFQCNIRDITERKRADLDLLSAQERLKEAHRLAHIGIWDWVMESDTVTWSDELYKIAGRDPSLPAPTYTEHPRVYTPASWDLLSSAVTRALTTGELYNLELELVRPDGNIRWVNAFGGVKRDGDGKVIGLYGTVQDITGRKRAEDVLRESEEKFHEIFDNAIDGIELIEITDDGYPGRFIDLNAIACKMVHYTKEELLKMSPLDINTENFSQPFDEIMKELHAIGNARFETEHRRKDGTIFPIEVNTHIVTILGKKVILSIVRDITERKQMETALILSEQTYHSYVDNSPEGIFVADGAGRYLDVNRAACNLLGYSREELLSMNVLDLALPEEEQQTLDQFTSTIERLKSESSVSLEMLLKKKDGSVCPVILSVVKLPDNAIMGFTLDITERKRAEEERSRLSAIVEHTDEAIISKTLDGIITSWNAGAERMYGYSAQEIVGKSVSLLVPPDHPDDTMTIFERVKNGDPVIRYETLRRKKDGGLINVTLTASPIRDAYNRLVGTSIIGHDVTERKKAEEALQQANKQLSLLSGITRHDILNQLFALKGYIELSHEEIDNPTKLIELIKKEEKVARTIEHQITFTRDYQELGAAAPEWQSVNASITKAVAGLPMRDLHVEVDPKNPEVFADRLFEKVFYNLLDNALRYGGEQMKTIRVLSQESDASLTIICEDDGVGITAEDKKKLFTKGFGKNTGLGLFLSREILAITGITITENGVPGKGARFEITVPKGMWRIKDVDA